MNRIVDILSSSVWYKLDKITLKPTGSSWKKASSEMALL